MPQAYLGLALVSADGYDNNAIVWATKALELDPKLVAAHELLAEIALEDSDTAQAIAQADEAIKLAPDALDAMAVHAAVEVLADRSPDAWFAKIRADQSHIRRGLRDRRAQFGVPQSRTKTRVAYYRKAIELDPQLWSARSELGINLMRLGQEDEPRRQLEMCYDNGYRNEATVNTLRLLDSYKNFDGVQGRHDHHQAQ